MNALNMAKTAYAAQQTPIRTTRGTEYEAFARITQRLNAAAGQGRAGFAKLVEAVYDNRQLWTTLAVDVADSENGLPNQLRAQIFYLAEFTALHSGKVLAGNENIDVLVEINTAIMRGLRTQEVSA